MTTIAEFKLLAKNPSAEDSATPQTRSDLIAAFQENKDRLIRLIGMRLAATIYRTLLVIGIAVMIAMKFPLVGLALAAFHLSTTIVSSAMKLGQYLLKSPETSSVRLRATVLAAITLIVLPLATLVAPMPFGVVVQGVVAAQNEHYLNADTPGVFESVNVEPGTFVNQDDVLATLSNAEVTADYQLTQASLQEVLLQWEVTHGQNIVEASRYEPRIKELKHQLLETQRQVAELELVAPGPGLVARALPGSQHGRYIQTGETIAIVVNGRPVLRTWLSEEQLGSVEVAAGTTVAFRIPGQSESTQTGRLLSIEPAAEHSNLNHALTYLAGGEILLNPQTGLSMDPMFQLDIEPNEQSALHLSNHGMRISLNLPRRYEPIASWVVRRVTRFVQKTLLA